MTLAAQPPQPAPRPRTPAAYVPAASGVPASVLPGSLGAETLQRAEWLLTNGLGGFAMGTASGVPTRRYHAWLISSLDPPVRRVAALNAVVDEVVLEGDGAGEEIVPLSTFRFS